MNLEYVAVGIVRRYAPESLLFAAMHLRGNRNVAEQSPDDYFTIWHTRLLRQGVSLAGKRILEVGSGRYARLALRMLAAGAVGVMLVDPYATSLADPAHRSMLLQDCAHLGLDADRALAQIVVVNADLTALPLPASSEQVDLVTSMSVLEHVRDPGHVLRCCYAWLKPGGTTCHVIDLRDHNLNFKYPFEMLTFSEATWSRWLDLRGGFHLNRWRVPQYLQAIADAGFTQVRYGALQRDDAGLRTIRARLHPQFQAVPDALLSVLMLEMYGEKPQEN